MSTPSSDSEFYIGWQAVAPPGHARRTRQAVYILVALVLILAGLLVGFQRGFSGGVFEFGGKTTLEGVLSLRPAPFLILDHGQTADGHPVIQNVLLVAPGKFGAEKVLVQEAPSPAREGQRLRITGALIYHDGKTALEIFDWQVLDAPPPVVHRQPSTVLGTVQLRGEVTDPKCLLGVMNPGFGKPHRDCAARCIAGGIPPVLKVSSESGETEYYLLAGPSGEALNDAVLPFVSDGISICGRLEQRGDWLVLFADLSTLRRINKASLNPGAMCH